MTRLLVIAKPGGRHGEVVAVKPDGHVWGRKEVPPSFEQIDLPGVSVARLADLLEPELTDDDDANFVARRKLRITDVQSAKAARNETELRMRVGAHNKRQ